MPVGVPIPCWFDLHSSGLQHIAGGWEQGPECCLESSAQCCACRDMHALRICLGCAESGTVPGMR